MEWAVVAMLIVGGFLLWGWFWFIDMLDDLCAYVEA